MKTFTQILAEANIEDRWEVVVSYSDLKGRVTRKGFKTRKSFDRWSTKNEGKIKIIDYIKYPD